MSVLLTKFCKNLKDHLIPKFLITHLSRLAKKNYDMTRRDYCYANVPNIKIAVSSNDLLLSLS